MDKECELNSIPEAWLVVLVVGDLEEFVNGRKDFFKIMEVDHGYFFQFLWQLILWIVTRVYTVGDRDCCIHLHIPVSEVKSLCRVRLFVTPWAVAYQAPLSMGFSRQ